MTTARLWLLPILLCAPSVAAAADWPQWMGPARNGSSPETGLLTDWSRQRPKVIWKVAGGDGYSSVAVVGDRAFTLVQRDGKELAVALEAATGKELWATPLGPAYKNQFGDGPRSTPAVDGALVYVQSVTGPLACLETSSGKVVWQHHLLKEYGAKNLQWGLAASPVIEGDLVLAVPGGKGAGVAAFNKKTGELTWKTGDDKAAYASPIVLAVGGTKQAIFFNAAGLLGVTLDAGSELWRMPWITEFDCNICTPQVNGDQIFVTSGESVGCAMLRLKAGAAPEVVWESKGPKSVLMCYWSTPVLHDGHLYGLSGEFSKRIDLRCVDARTGKQVWSQPGFGKAAVTLADGHLFLTTKTGDLVVVAASPAAYKEKGRMRILGENRTMPTVSGRKLFLRDRQEILCLDVAAPTEEKKAKDQARTINDEAALFSEAARQKANAAIAEIKKRYHKDLFIETLKSAPGADKADLSTAEAKQRFYSALAGRRATQAGIDGIYVLITTQPKRVQALSGKETIRQGLFTAENANALAQKIIAQLKADEFDEALLQGVAYVSEVLSRAKRPEKSDSDTPSR
jgi:outer membrane protein assembly factor BamB